ncbi:MAG TPA: ATP-binding protein [Polyangiales bacterium]|nr:ATP-binding protein [Polyangiales bacterium]
MSLAYPETVQWRGALLEGALRVFAVVAVGLWLAVVLFPLRAAWLSLWIACLAGASIAICALPKLGYRTRALALLICLHALCAGPLLHSAVAAPNLSAGFLLEAVLATLLFRQRGGLFVVVAIASTFVIVLLTQRISPPMRQIEWYRGFDTTHADVAMRVALVVCATSLSAVLGVGHLLRSLEGAVAERDSTRKKLEEAHLARVQVMQELDVREAEYLRARELEVLGRLAGYVAHDFNNALLAIFGGVELMRRAHTEMERSDALAIVDSAATQAASTAKQLRAFGPQARRDPKPVDAALVARSAERMLRTLLPKNIALKLNTELTPKILADEGLVQSALMNLALNAWDAMRDGGTLEINVRPAASDHFAAHGCVVIAVKDSGVGMDEATVARVFAPFFTTKGSQGSGLGLASVRKTVEDAGGTVSVQSALGRGTTVELRWPALAETDRVASSAPPGPGEFGGKVLILDEDQAVRRTVTTYLRRCGITAFDAKTWDEALRLAAANQIDVVVTDAVLPGISPVALLRELKRSSPSLRVVLCSGGDPYDFEAAQQLADTTLAKPFSLDTLVRQLRSLMRRPPRTD